MSDDIENGTGTGEAAGEGTGTETTGGNHTHEVDNGDGTTSTIELEGLKDDNSEETAVKEAVSPRMHVRLQIFTN